MLKYYDISEEIAIQCDLSETGLGAEETHRFCIQSFDRYGNALRPDRKIIISHRVVH